MQERKRNCNQWKGIKEREKERKREREKERKGEREKERKRKKRKEGAKRRRKEKKRRQKENGRETEGEEGGGQGIMKGRRSREIEEEREIRRKRNGKRPMWSKTAVLSCRAVTAPLVYVVTIHGWVDSILRNIFHRAKLFGIASKGVSADSNRGAKFYPISTPSKGQFLPDFYSLTPAQLPEQTFFFEMGRS